jgi:HEPN domain-containing protein/predicted RNA-binding Zn-ribbon protein involved in translation (DUF1610 family)
VADGTEEAYVECANCGASLDPSHEGPCPSCGELAGTITRVKALSAALSMAAATATVSEWWEQRYKFLLDTARDLRSQGHPEAAIVTAQTAFEVCLGAVLTEALRKRVGDAAVADLITGALRPYNPKNDRVQKWYETLFEHRIQAEPFWQSLRKHVDRRNRVVHRGEEATAQEADESIKAVDAAIRHLLKNRS